MMSKAEKCATPDVTYSYQELGARVENLDGCEVD